MKLTQKEYELQIPFGHDDGEGSGWPNLMRHYKTGGTPWVIILNSSHEVTFNNFHIDEDQAIELITEELTKN